MDRYGITSLIVWIVATVEATGGLLGIWTVTGADRSVILAVEAALLLVLLINSYAIKNWVYRHSTCTRFRTVAWLGFASLALCVVGDVINFNLPQTFYRHGVLVKHGYLADSVWFFAPGYLLLFIAAIRVALSNKLKASTLALILLVGAVIGAVSFASIYLPGTGFYVSAITGGYAAFIAMVGASGVALLVSAGGIRARPGVWLVSAGLLLAAIADAVIGQFWIFGNNGEGYFPAARYANWILYIGSQCLVIHLARVAVKERQRGVVG